MVCSAEILRTKGIQASYGISKFIDVGEAKYLGRNIVHGNVKRRDVTNARPAAMPARVSPFRLSRSTERIILIRLVQLARVPFKGQVAASSLAEFR